MNDEQLNVGLERMKDINEKRNEHRKKTFEKAKVCKQCNTNMVYIYGEMYQCPVCGRKELSDFGKVREFLDANGPQPAAVIADATGVSLHAIDQFLRQGRVEIPDGSDVYIKCQNCGTEIRYGRYCPECMAKISKNINAAVWNQDVGEKPKMKHNAAGKMHTLEDSKKRRGGYKK